jgi:hypothetical protein
MQLRVLLGAFCGPLAAGASRTSRLSCTAVSLHAPSYLGTRAALLRQPRPELLMPVRRRKRTAHDDPPAAARERPRATQRLVRTLADDAPDTQRQLLPTRLAVRGSTAPPGATSLGCLFIWGKAAAAAHASQPAATTLAYLGGIPIHGVGGCPVRLAGSRRRVLALRC